MSTDGNLWENLSGLPRAVKALLGGYALSAFGTGLVLIFTPVYLVEARGFSVTTVGVVLGTAAASGLAMALLSGTLVDRGAARAAAVVGAAAQATGVIVLALADSPVEAVVGQVIFGAGHGCFAPAWMTLLTRATDPNQRPYVFSLQYMLSNLGIAVGALGGGIALGSGSVSRFQAMYALDALTFALLAALVFAFMRAGSVNAGEQIESRSADRSYLRALRHRDLALLLAVGFCTLAFGAAQLESGVPLLARLELGAAQWMLGFAAAANTLAVLAFQLPMTRVTRAWRRETLLVAMGGVWVGAWLFGLIGTALGGGAALVGIAFAYALFGLSECLFSPAFSPLVAELADPEDLGRYSALAMLSIGAGEAVGPVLGTVLLASTSPVLFWTTLTIGAVGTLALSQSLRRLRNMKLIAA